MDQLPDNWLAEVCRWASDEPLVKAAYAYGSRVKGTARPGSDLDIAIQLSGTDTGEQLANWICEADRLTKSLAARLPVELHLEAINEDDNYVGPAVAEHGVMLFQREEHG